MIMREYIYLVVSYTKDTVLIISIELIEIIIPI